MKAPDDFSLGHVGQRLEQCLLVAINDLAVFMGEKGTDEFRGIGQHATKQAQEGDAAAPLIIGHAQQGTEEAIDDLRRLERLAVKTEAMVQ